MTKTYDYIIVGAGSAGCLLAERLSRSGKHQVLLVEAGKKDNKQEIKIPSAHRGANFYAPSSEFQAVASEAKRFATEPVQPSDLQAQSTPAESVRSQPTAEWFASSAE